MKSIPITFLIIAVSLKVYPQHKANSFDEFEIDIDGIQLPMEKAMEDRNINGISLAVFENYKIKELQAWGLKDAVSKDEMNENTIFCTASIAKPISALLFAILEDKGLINLKADVSVFLKRWKIPVNEKNAGIKLTFEHLLSHTAGTSQHGHIDFYSGDSIPTPVQSLNGQIAGGNRALRFLDIPGTSWRYSGGAYVIAQIALEDYLGKSFAEIAKEHLFDPLELKNTTFYQPNEPQFAYTNVAKSHDDQGNLIRDGIQITPQLAPSGLWSTPEELSLVIIEIQKALAGIKTDIISDSCANRVTEVITTDVMGGWSLGWERRYRFGNRDWFSHGGANTGMGGYVYGTMEEGNGMVILGNAGNRIRIPVENAIRDKIIDSNKWKVSLDTSEYKPIGPSFGKKLAGNYCSYDFAELIPVEYLDGRLWIKNFDGGRTLELFHLGHKTFKVDESNRLLRFNQISPWDNKPYLTVIFQNGVYTDVKYSFFKVGERLPIEYLLEEDYNLFSSEYQRIVESYPNSDLVSESYFYRMGNAELAKDNAANAIKIFKAMTEIFPESIHAFNGLAKSYMQIGDNKKAVDNFQITLEKLQNEEKKNEAWIKWVREQLEKLN
ncbi:serine hydrolase [Muricauda sp. JGD-17]|uniref:Serine hydrolase n=1 Tax=Flagellimonas ochracea TaxID=2696472 RepID=A0A964TF85_9FLAO|nr:serine hydrolase [Allomuricauda ochracea]NAY93344.1 serine hydrolase [Allomuricauda ochracea]